MDFVVKHPHAYNFLPEPHTKFYHVSEFLTVADDLWLDGFRNCYNLYINANCWETNQLCHIVADWTHQFYEGVQYLYALHGDKLLQNVGYMVQAIDDLFRTVSLQLDTTQLDLFPELKKPKTGEVVDYRKTIYK